MKFFSDLVQNKRSMIGITGLLSNITSRPDSHKGGWTRLLKCQLLNAGYNFVYQLGPEHELEEFEVLIFDLGAEYSGAINLFGGFTDDVLERLRTLEKYKGQLYSWHHDPPDLRECMKGREKVESTSKVAKYEIKRGILKEVQAKLAKCQTFDHVEPLPGLFICDSHGPAVWTPRYMIHRTDGLTLHRFLEDDLLQTRLDEHESVTEIMIHISSIDVRHHLCRLPDPVNSTVQLVDDLHTALKKTPCRVVVSETMGIENENRKLPKTGYYKGSPFYGSWEQRNHIRNVFNSRLHEYQGLHFEVLRYPVTFFEPLRGSLRFDVMEKPQSVHISPMYYRWDLDHNKPRWEY